MKPSDHDDLLEFQALDLIARVQDEAEFEGRCPNWMIPPQIPVQRLQGLKRCGFLDFEGGFWSLTMLGCGRLDHLRSNEADQP